MDQFSPEQLSKFEQFKSRVSDAMKDQPDIATTDTEMVRWLCARSWNIDKAEDMYRKNIQWRKDYKPELILNNYKPNEVRRMKAESFIFINYFY